MDRIVSKKISEMSSDELAARMRPVGVNGLPYPMAKFEKGASGTTENKVGVIQSAQTPLLVPTDLSVERVTGMLFRQMPIPGMMLMLRDLLAKIQPDSNNHIMTVLGDAAFGKSHLFKLIAGMVHPQGAIHVDCGGMNMREIFFRTVIDYGKGEKEVFEKRLSQGRITQTTLDTLEHEFPGSIVKSGDKVGINWDAVGKPRQEPSKEPTRAGEMVTVEDRGEAAARGAALLTALYKNEGIGIQNNAFGVKNVPGEVFESIETGRPLFLDEFNKSKHGTLDAFQTFLQFCNGEFPTVTIRNQMAEASETDSPMSITLKKEDIRLGWFVGIAGNDKSDGDTTQEISESMESRLNPMRIGNPETRDWTHRISQVWTGLPLVTLYNLFEKDAKAYPEKFAKFLVDLRYLGLDANERKAVPAHEIFFLQNFPKTVQAINQVAAYYDQRVKLSDPDSDLLKQPAYKDLPDEIAARGHNIFVTFRKAIADFNRAMQSTPEVRDAAEATLSLDLSEIFKSLDTSSIGKAMPPWHKFGANYARTIMEDIANDTLRMPKTNAALMTVCEVHGIFPPDLQEARRSPMEEGVQPLIDLMKYDELAGYGGTEELIEVRNVLMACLKNIEPDLKGSDQQTIPLDSLGRALKSLDEEKAKTDAKVKAAQEAREKAEKEGRDPAPDDVHPRYIALPNENLDDVEGQPLVMGQGLPNYLLPKPMESATYRLVDFRTALASLAVPNWAESNRAHIWAVDLAKHLQNEDDEDPEATLEAMTTVMGKSPIGFDISVMAAVDADKKPVYLYVIDDKERKKMLITGPSAISNDLMGELKKNGIQYVNRTEAGAAVVINDFLGDGATYRAENNGLDHNNTQSVIEGLIKAFSALCLLGGGEDGNEPQTVPKGSTLGDVITKSDSEPSVYTSIVVPKQPRRMA